MTVASSVAMRLAEIPAEETVAGLLARAEEVAAFCAANADAVDAEGAFPVEEFERVANSGLLRAPLPQRLGGLGLGEQGRWLPLLLLLKTIGRGNLAVGRVYEGHVNALQLVLSYGTSEQIAAYAAEARAGHLFAVWNTEAGDGVQIVPLGKGRYRLEGAKTFASGAGYVSRPFANGRLPCGGWQMCIVPLDCVTTQTDPSAWRPRGMRASASFRVDFSGVEVTDHELIGAPGDYTREPWFSGGAIRFAAVQLGAAEALLDATRQHLRQSGRGDDPYQRMRVGELAVLVESGNQWLRGAAAVADNPDAPATALVAYAGMTRSAIEQICLEAMRLAERSVGVKAMLRPQPIERIGRDLSTYLRQPAPDAALANVGRFVLEAGEPAERLWPTSAEGRR